MKRNASTILLVIVALVGVALILYPSISDAWNSHTQTRALVDYETKVGAFTDDEKREKLEEARSYNEALRGLSYPLSDYAQLDSRTDIPGYVDLLNVSDGGIMGSVTIPKIGVNLPIYHGVGDNVLNVAVGHLPGTSLPVGGPGTHCVLSAHRGLPRAKLFTDLDQLELGDTFSISVLGQDRRYVVDQISIVLPNEVDGLYPVDGEEYVTLMTCTPYGINTHRLLVRGHAEEVGEGLINVPAEAVRVNELTLALASLAFVLFAMLVARPGTRRDEDDEPTLDQVKRLR